jgi:hypothetical protein
MTDINRREALTADAALTVAATNITASPAPDPRVLTGLAIRHTVLFCLKWPPGSAAEAGFFKATEVLASLPQVQHFERLRQVSHKNNFKFGLSMQFADEAAYASYNQHPTHLAFVRDHWIPNVEEFMEVDYVPFS